MKRERVILGLLAALVLMACGTTAGSGGSSYQGKTIKLGALLSITGAGGVYGPQSRDGMKLAVEQINGSGGVNGAQIDLEVRDDASDKAQSAQQAQTMIQQDQLMALLGPTLSNSAVGVHPLAENLKTPILAVSTTGIHIVPDCNYPSSAPCKYVFRDSLVAQDDKFSSDGGKIVQDTVSKYNINLLKVIKFSKTEADLSPYVTQAVQLKPDVIFITSLGGI